jgi:hypothetical protein
MLERGGSISLRPLIELLIDRVLVTDEAVEIRYVIPTHPRSEHVRFCQLRKDYFQIVAQIAVGPVGHPLPEDVPNGARIGIMAGAWRC